VGLSWAWLGYNRFDGVRLILMELRWLGGEGLRLNELGFSSIELPGSNQKV